MIRANKEIRKVIAAGALQKSLSKEIAETDAMYGRVAMTGEPEHLIVGLEYYAGLSEDEFTKAGDGRAVGRFNKQLPANQSLQSFYLSGHRRLTKPEFACGFGQAARLGNGYNSTN